MHTILQDMMVAPSEGNSSDRDEVGEELQDLKDVENLIKLVENNKEKIV